MTTSELLSRVYAAIFEIPVKADYSGQMYEDTAIEYTSFRLRSSDYDADADMIEAVTADGNEGAWIDIYRIRRKERVMIGFIKTLDSGRGAWRNMGALAGEINYVANYTAIA